jgi:hypothetical protein
MTIILIIVAILLLAVLAAKKSRPSKMTKARAGLALNPPSVRQPVAIPATKQRSSHPAFSSLRKFLT